MPERQANRALELLSVGSAARRISHATASVAAPAVVALAAPAHMAPGFPGAPPGAPGSVKRSSGTISVTLSPGDTHCARKIAA